MNASRSAVFGFLALGFGAVAVRGSSPISEAAAPVCVRVLPQIAVSEPVVVVIDLEDPLVSSPIPSQVRFWVRANTQGVELQVACTDLYRFGDPGSGTRIPVGGLGAEITCGHGDDRLLAWQPTAPAGVLPAGWTGAVSEVGVFTAWPALTFSQDVTVNVSWQTSDSDLPRGEYGGIVELIGLVHP